MRHRGYEFAAGMDRAAEIGRCEHDLAGVVPWLQRFDTPVELEYGFTEGRFRGHLIADGVALLFK